MFKEGQIITNVRRDKIGEVIKFHKDLGIETQALECQNAYTVAVMGKWEVWLERSDFLETYPK